MRYPRRLLNAGEEVVLDLRPHWWYVSGPVAALLVVIGGSIAEAVQGAPRWIDAVTLSALVVAAGWLVGRYVRWSTSRLVVTTSRLIERQGVLARRGREIPLTALTDIGYRQTIFERIIGAGRIVLESAGRDGREVFPDVPRPSSVQNAIYRQIELARRSQSSCAAPALHGAVRGATPDGGYAPGRQTHRQSIPEQIAQLDDLRRRGVITDTEFREKKAELLSRM